METIQVQGKEKPQIKEERMKEQHQNHYNSLSAQRLKVTLYFLAYLNSQESEEATQELLAMPNLERELAEAEQSIKEEGTVNWRSVRDDVWE